MKCSFRGSGPPTLHMQHVRAEVARSGTQQCPASSAPSDISVAAHQRSCPKSCSAGTDNPAPLFATPEANAQCTCSDQSCKVRRPRLPDRSLNTRVAFFLLAELPGERWGCTTLAWKTPLLVRAGTAFSQAFV